MCLQRNGEERDKHKVCIKLHVKPWPPRLWLSKQLSKKIKSSENISKQILKLKPTPQLFLEKKFPTKKTVSRRLFCFDFIDDDHNYQANKFSLVRHVYF